jgi:nucleotide-binding universal stress UspA family protein
MALLKGAVVVEIRSVLCPVDFSDFSRRALDHAVTVARWYGARLAVLYSTSNVIFALMRYATILLSLTTPSKFLIQIDLICSTVLPASLTAR